MRLSSLFQQLLVILLVGCVLSVARAEEACTGNCEILKALNTTSGEFKSRVVIKGCNGPVGVLEPLPKLPIRSLTISGCGITRVHENAFDGLADTLIELNLSNNSITTMPFLKKLRKLQIINLNRNMIKDIPERAFEDLDQLRYLRLKKNRICFILPNALSEVKGNLELLDLSNNCLAAVPAQNLRNAVGLTHLSLTGNQITEVSQMAFMGLPKLIELRLNANRIKQISPAGFMHVPQLRYLLVRDNSLTALDPATMQALKELEVIDLSKNNLQRLPSFKDLSNLVQVRADYNRIKQIDTLTFSSNPKLALIGLQSNEISTISRNSFDALDGLTTLILSNNSLPSIERGIFDGMKNLKYLLLRNNTVTDIDGDAFSSLPDLVVADLSYNKLRRIRSGTFAKHTKLYLVNLSNNEITSFETGAFENKVAAIFLDGNPLNCDAEFDWFVSYLVRKAVRTFVPNQPEITCASPANLVGVRLKELMIKKANDTLTTSMQALGFGSAPNPQDMNFLARLIPGYAGGKGLQGIGAMGSPHGAAPVMKSLTQAMPSLREIPGINFLATNGAQGPTGANRELDSAINQFAKPLMNFATGSQSMATDVNQLLQSIPNLVVNIPNIGDIDVSKLPPALIQDVLNGREVPGIPRETVDKLLKQYMERVYHAAAAAQGLKPEGVAPIPEGVDPKKYLLPASNIPGKIVKDLMEGQPLPHLTTSQTRTVMEYYTQQMPSVDGKPNATANLTELFSPKFIQMMKLLPPGYNITKLSPQIMKSAMAGEMPDLTLLPLDLQQYLTANMDRLFNTLSSESDLSIDDILKKLPKFEQPLRATYSPYDINKVDDDLVIQKSEKNDYTRLITAIALGLVGTSTVAVLVIFCYTKAGQVSS